MTRITRVLSDIDWEETFAALRDVDFDGIAAVCVFGWEEDARPGDG